MRLSMRDLFQHFLFVQGIYSRYKQVEWNAEYIQRKYGFNLTDRVLCAGHWRSETMVKKNSQYCLVVFGNSGDGKSVCKRLKGVISVDGNNKEAVMASYISDKISRIPINGTS